MWSASGIPTLWFNPTVPWPVALYPCSGKLATAAQLWTHGGTQRGNPMQHCAFNDTLGVTSAGSSTSRNGLPMPSRVNRETSSLPTSFPPLTLQRIWSWWETSPALHLFEEAVLVQGSATRWGECPIAVPSARQHLCLSCSICLQTLLGGSCTLQHTPALAQGVTRGVCFSSSPQGSLLSQAAD